jgi:hypothetical protein
MLAVTAAPTPADDGSTMVIGGAYRYPLPLFVTAILVMTPATTVAVAVACIPPSTSGAGILTVADA